MVHLSLDYLVDVIVNVAVCASLCENFVAELNKLTRDAWEFLVKTRSFLDRFSVLLEV
jgi:hypothetical protein